MKRSLMVAGSLVLALILVACGGAPSTPAAAGTTAANTVATAAGVATNVSTNPTAQAAVGDAVATAAVVATNVVADPTVQAAVGGAANTIVGAAAADPRFSTIVGILNTSGLASQLEAAGPFTFFAPTNEALTALPGGTLEALAQDPTLLQKILLYHVIQQKVLSSDITSPITAPTLAGETLEVTNTNGMVMINGTAMVIAADIQAGNGVIHGIDKLLLPPDVALPGAAGGQ